ncbi:MAG: HlyD family type I secretion periplasmic adaptor subunit [Pseudomonadota bacterium]
MKTRWSWSTLAWVGMLVIVALVLGLGVWGSQTKIAGAVIAPGKVSVEAGAQVVQHLDGGIVAEVHVRDGDIVAAGTPLLRLDGSAMRSELAIITDQLDEITARTIRLRAERDGLSALDFGDTLQNRAGRDPALAELLAGQSNLFAARQRSQDKLKSSYREQQAQIEAEIIGQEAQILAADLQLDYISSEIDDLQSLLERGLTPAGRVLALRREHARLSGERGQTVAAIARNRGQISQIDTELERQEADRREQVVTELRELTASAAELQERRTALEERLSRLDLKAPMDEMVHNLQVRTLNAVIRPANPVLYIVPQMQELIVTVRVPALQVDAVHIWQAAQMRFSAFDARTTPELKGTVQRISPDVLIDQHTGQEYYTADLVPNKGELDILDGLPIVVGMPVETFVQTGERSPLNYLIKPLADYFRHAFREA